MIEPAKIRRLMTGLSSRSAARREGTVRGLVLMGAEAAPALVEALNSKRWLARRGALLALAQMDDSNWLPQIRECLDDLEVGVRHAAIQALGKLQDRQSLPRLHMLVMRGKLDILPVVIEALAVIGDPASAPPLCTALDAPDMAPHLVPLLIWALGEIGRPGTVSTLCNGSAAQRGLPTSRVEDALVRIGSKHPEALVTQLVTEGPGTEALIGALVRLGAAVQPALWQAADGPPNRAQWCARILLAARGDGRLEWLGDLCSTAQNDPVRLRLLAANGLEQLAQAHASPALRTALPALRSAAAFWQAPPELRQALRAAISQIEASTRSLSRLPLPADAIPDAGAALPRVAEGVPHNQGLPVPATLYVSLPATSLPPPAQEDR